MAVKNRNDPQTASNSYSKEKSDFEFFYFVEIKALLGRVKLTYCFLPHAQNLGRITGFILQKYSDADATVH